MQSKVKTAIVEGRVDARSLASIASALTSHGVQVPSKSALVSMIIESYADMLISSGQADHITSTEHALEILENLNINFREARRRNLKTLSKQIGAERAMDLLSQNLGMGKIQENLVPENLVEKAQSILEGGKDEN